MAGALAAACVTGGAGAGGNGWMLGNARLHDKLGTDLGAIAGSGEKTLAGGPQPIKAVWFPTPPGEITGVPDSANDRAVAGVWYQLPDGREGIPAYAAEPDPAGVVLRIARTEAKWFLRDGDEAGCLFNVGPDPNGSTAATVASTYPAGTRP